MADDLLRRFLRWVNTGGATSCDHAWRCIRVTHGWHLGGWVTPSGPFTTGMWKCQRCGARRVSEHDGTWTANELND